MKCSFGHRHREMGAFFSCMAWRAIPGPLSKRKRRLARKQSSLSGKESAQGCLPMKFGERTRNCSPGQAGKEGPHLAMTVGFCKQRALPHGKGALCACLDAARQGGWCVACAGLLHRHRGLGEDEQVRTLVTELPPDMRESWTQGLCLEDCGFGRGLSLLNCVWCN